MGKWFNWPPFVAVALDADTGKPLDPNIGMRTYCEFYDVKKNGRGKKMIVAHKSVSGHGSKVAEEVKKNGNGKEDKKNGNGKDGGKGGGDEKKNEGGGGGQDHDKPWTAEEDAKLKKLKGEPGWTNAQIGQEIGGRSKKQVAARWNEIKGDGEDAGAAAKKDEGGKKNEGGKDKADKKKENKKENKKQAAEKKAPSNAGSGQARFTMNEWMTLQEDDLFSFGELQCLSELMMRDERQRCMRIASAFFDKTGRRVHPEDIHDKFLEMGAMGSQR